MHIESSRKTITLVTPKDILALGTPKYILALGTPKDNYFRNLERQLFCASKDNCIRNIEGQLFAKWSWR